MLNKPEQCKSCPLYGDGTGFVPDEIVEGAEVLVQLQGPGDCEEKGLKVIDYEQKRPIHQACKPAPTIGPTGWMQEREFFPLAGLKRGENVSIANTIRCRWRDPATGKHTNTLPPVNILRPAVDICNRNYSRIPSSTNLIIAQGKLAWEHLTHQTTVTDQTRRMKISDWRGYLAPEPYAGIPVYGVLHIADLMRDNVQRFVAKADWAKVKKIRAGEWPEQLPEPTVLAAGRMEGGSIDQMASWFDRAYRAPYIAIDTEYNEKTKFLYLVGLGFPTADGSVDALQFQWSSTGISKAVKQKFLISLNQLVREVPALFQNKAADLPVLRQNLSIRYSYYRQIHDTMLLHAVLWSEMPHKLEFLMSIYGKYRKLKHLAHTDPLLYNLGDVVELVWVWEALKAEAALDPQSWSIYEQQSLKVADAVIEQADRGLRVSPEGVKRVMPKLAAGASEALRLIHAAAGWPINPNSPVQKKVQLYDVMGLPKQKNLSTRKITTDKDAINALRQLYLPVPEASVEDFTPDYIAERLEEGGHPLLEGLAAWGKTEQLLTSYILPLLR